jgi:hypothetical protein
VTIVAKSFMFQTILLAHRQIYCTEARLGIPLGLRNTQKKDCPTSKSVTGEKTKKTVDTDRSIQGLEHVFFSEGKNLK